jgi:hypothetical protein
VAFQVALIALFGIVLSSPVLVPPGMLCCAVLVLYPVFFRTSAGFVFVSDVGLGDWSSCCLGLGSFLCILWGFFCFLLVVFPVGFVAAGDRSLFRFCMVVRLVVFCFFFVWLISCFIVCRVSFSHLLIC